ncbi:uncharacterized protein LOC107857570 isoform X2 [Capsicum annuum]|uniref:uncharacterized protein LOC107857570 isoform X2 n=1 Tax=Capsicum annuum TaxID=4072 RepID=UPI001FB17F22|nr:uncharacterized protein LOC107857570 isoform X2 [Capsicum annuum]XP_047262435.1 uncharacterized protein LOC107857570 isoform X2 [Capsicum annuum]
MYVRRIRSNNQRWNLVFQRFSSGYRTYSPTKSSSATQIPLDCNSLGSVVGRALLDKSKSIQTASQRGNIRLLRSSPASWRWKHLRYFSSKGDGRDASEDKHVHTRDSTTSDKATVRKEKSGQDVRHCDAHTQLGEQEQKEWLRNEKLSIESKKKESPFLSRRERFKNEFLRRVVPWEKIALSWDAFPYYIHEHTKNVLMECVASHLKHKKVTVAYGGRLSSSSGRIMLQSIPGTELYRERLVRTLARDLKVRLLVLDSSILAPYDFGEDCSSESESDVESGEECTSDSEIEDANDASNAEEWTSAETKSEASEEDVDVEASVEALEKLIPFSLEDFEKSVSGELESSSESTSEAVDQSEKAQRPFKKGDRVKYTGPSGVVKADNRSMSSGQRGEIYEVNGDQVAVIFDVSEKQTTEEDKDEKLKAQDVKPSIYWIPANEIEHDLDAQAEDCYIAMEVLCEVLKSAQPIIVYFPDSSLWLSRAVSKANRKEFVHKVQEMFDQLSGPVVLICGRNKAETGSKEKEKFTMILPNLGRLAKLPLSLKRLTEGLRATKRSVDDDIHSLFSNVMSIHPPKEEGLLRTFNKQIEEDRRIVIARSNLNELYKVLEEHELSCIDLLHVNTDDVILTKQKAEKVIGWAKNHYLYTCLHPSIKGDRLYLPRESIETAILRLKEQETMSKKPSQNLKNLAKDEYENNFVSAVVPQGEIGVKFDDIGALEEVKKALNELVILPMRRPELFSRGNLLRPCKGILLFGPPGTGKTLVAKALATEAGANFISITGSTLTSKWFGDAEKLTKALFSFASKLAPVIIFVDEVDSLLGARGGSFEHEATRRMRNEFMAAWDGLRSKENQRILILGATNRPFDLDDAVIRRLPRRIYVDLPDAANRLKILKIILARENLESEFPYENLANATEGYSGSDLKNLCIAAAYKPVQEILEEEKELESPGSRKDGIPVLRPLAIDDFIQSKAKVGPSVAYDAASMNELRKWNDQYGEGGSRRKSPFGF